MAPAVNGWPWTVEGTCLGTQDEMQRGCPPTPLPGHWPASPLLTGVFGILVAWNAAHQQGAGQGVVVQRDGPQHGQHGRPLEASQRLLRRGEAGCSRLGASNEQGEAPRSRISLAALSGSIAGAMMVVTASWTPAPLLVGLGPCSLVWRQPRCADWLWHALALEGTPGPHTPQYNRTACCRTRSWAASGPLSSRQAAREEG